MRKNNDAARIATLFAMAAIMNGQNPFADPFALPKETAEQKARRLADAERKRKLAQGLQEYHYAGGTIWALNQKNADRKAHAKGWL